MTLLKPLSRRTLLKGAGASIALPFLEAMLAPRTSWSQARSPTRFIVFHPDGAFYQSETDGGDLRSKHGQASIDGIKAMRIPETTLAALGDMRNRVFTVHGLRNDLKNHGNAHNSLSFLTRQETPDQDLPADMPRSLDQIVADTLHDPGVNRFKYVAVSAGSGGWAAGGAMSVGPGGQIMPFSYRTRDLFDKLFTGFSPTPPAPGVVDPKNKRRLSVLHLVKEDISGLNRKLGPTDRQMLDRHLTSIEEVEASLDVPTAAPRAICQPPAMVDDLTSIMTATWADHDQMLSTMLNLIALALECDLTRVVTMGGIYPGKCRFSGFDARVPTDFEFHDHLLHNEHVPAMATTLRADIMRGINRWMMTRVGGFLRRLDSNVDVDGRSLLYHSLFYLGSNHSVTAGHEIDNAPQVIAGNASGRIASPDGSQIVYPYQTPLTDFQFTLLKKLGSPATTHGAWGQNQMLGSI